MARIVILESGDEVEHVLGPPLRDKGHQVVKLTVAELLNKPEFVPDLVILHLASDIGRGVEDVRRLVECDMGGTIAIVSPPTEEPAEARAALINAGAVDAMTLPIHLGEALARIEAYLATRAYLDKLLSIAALDLDTGAYSRWLFEKRLAEEVMKASRYPMPLSCLLVSLDQYGELRKQHGKTFVRTVLHDLALIIENSLRISDFVARYEEKEFAVILPFTEPTDALVCAERIRSRTEVFPFRELKVSENATVSIGVAGYSVKRTGTPELLMAEARICLEFAQKSGGNRVVADEEYLPRGTQKTMAYDKLIETLRSGDEWEQMRAYHALREAGPPAIPELLRAAQDPSPSVRRFCASVLGFMAAKESTAVLRTLLSDEVREVRAVAAWALGRLGDSSIVPDLIARITDEDAQVRAAAALSICKLTRNVISPHLTESMEDLHKEAERCQKIWAECQKTGQNR